MFEQGFEVATEFRFDIGQAMLNTKALQGAVGALSNEADNALNSLHYLAGGLVTRLGFGSGGVLSILTQAVEASEQFQKNSMNLASTIGANFDVLTGSVHGFNEQLAAGKTIMGDIHSQAIKMGLPANELAQYTQRLAAPLAHAGKGMAGRNFSNARQMAGNLMVASQSMGLHPQVAAESLTRALTDRMALHGALFARMVNTPAFKAAHIKTQQQLTGMQTEKKVELLNRALEQLAGNSEFIAYRMNQLSTQMIVMKEAIGAFLRPIGDALANTLKIAMKQINAIIISKGQALGESLASLINRFLGDPEKTFIGLQQLKNLKNDMKKSLHFIEIALMLKFLGSVLKFLGFQGGLVTRALGALWSALVDFGAWIIAIIPWAKALSFVGKLMLGLVEYLGYFAGALVVFQGLSRGAAQAKVSDVKDMIELAPRISALAIRFSDALQNLFLPFQMAIQGIADMTEWFFKMSTWAKVGLFFGEGLVELLEKLGFYLYSATAGLSAILNVIVAFIMDLINLRNPFTDVSKNFTEGIEDFMTAHPFAGMNEQKPGKAVVNNYNNVTARFDMREQLEPDRIAFAVTEKLKKLAMNPTQGRNNSINQVYGGNIGWAGNR